MLRTLNPFNTKRQLISFDRYQLEVNKLYNLIFHKRGSITVRFIQTTPKSYNLLNVDTGRCIFATSMPDANFGNTVNVKTVGMLLAKEYFTITSSNSEDAIDHEEIKKYRDGFMRILWIGKDNSTVEMKNENETEN